MGHHLARRLVNEGYMVRVVDLEYPAYGFIDGVDYVIADLRDKQQVKRWIVDKYQEPFVKSQLFDEYYQLAADMGGALYVFSGDHDADIMSNSASININVLEALKDQGFKGKIFYSSSACMYPQGLQDRPNNLGLAEADAYPAWPDSEYGWEKLFSERLYLAYARNYGLNVRIARFHNIYGPEGTYKGGREKAPAAICRKVLEAVKDEFDLGIIEVWGDGEQTRSFLYIEDCIDAVRLLMQSDFKEPINIGSEEMVSINRLVGIAMDLSKDSFLVQHIDGPQGVRGRNSDNTLIRKVLNWEPKWNLKQGIGVLYAWIKSQYGV